MSKVGRFPAKQGYFTGMGATRHIQTLFRKLFSNFESYLIFKFHRLFWRQRFRFKSQSITANKPFPNLSFFSLIRYPTLGCVSHLQKLYHQFLQRTRPQHCLQDGLSAKKPNMSCYIFGKRYLPILKKEEKSPRPISYEHSLHLAYYNLKKELIIYMINI